ncbi:hypothetical protein Tco_0991609 [Tanacetum coccineum]|uniref:Uncharacterized protein n=1 Tax=Tanacetum coccineum TaxID=301880 RepID=A0ABQ5EZZ1_9ASTR
MDSIILLGQKNTLAEYMILSDTDNRPPMLDKDLLPPEWSKFVTDVKLVKNLHTTNFDQFHAYLEQHELHANEVCLVVLVFSSGDDLIAGLNKAMAFLTVVASSRYSGTGYKSNATSSGGNNASGQSRVVTGKAWYKDKATLVEAQEAGQILDEEKLAFLADPGVPNGQAIQTIIPNNVSFQTEDLDTYDSDCDDISNAKAVLMANISITTHNFHLFLDLAKPRKEKKGLQAVLKPRFKKNKGS